MKKHTTSKKLLALLLALIMTVSLLPMSVFAADVDVPETEPQVTEPVEEDVQEPEVTDVEPAEDAADVTDADTQAAEDEVAVQAADTTFKYKILHLDCGRKYFTKNWIIALLNEMSAAGYNQLQLAFGNDGLRFLLDDMSFTANGTTYSHETVVSKVEAGNKAQNSSGDASWLKQSEMDEIIAAANKLGIEIVPLLNLPGHANAILDIVDDAYNASGSNNTLNVVSSSDTARNFGLAIFKKYVDYFANKGCKFFNFGADEYANDASGTFSFGRLSSTEYANFVNFINSLAEYIENKGMTPRAFNDGLYYGSYSNNVTIDKSIQCCYWSSGWSGYNVAKANTIFGKGHSMINTHGDYYYVLGKDDAFTPNKTTTHDAGLYTAAAGFSNTTFADGNTVSPVGSMFCIWCDYPNAETEQQVAANTRLVLRAMAQRMDGQSIDNMSTAVVANGFNEDGTLNSTKGETGGDTELTTVDITLTVGQTSKEYTQTGDVTGNVNTDGYDSTVASYKTEYKLVEGKTEKALGTKQTSFTTDGTSGVISDGTNYMVIGSNGQISSTTDINAATEFTVTKYYPYGSYYDYYYYYIKSGSYYLTVTRSGRYGSYTYALGTSTNVHYWDYSSTLGFDDNNYSRYLTYSNGWTVTNSANSAVGLYTVTTKTTDPVNKTVITFTGKKVGDTSITIGNVKYNITVVAEDLTNVDPLTVQYWITNSRLTGATDKVNQISIKATDNKVATAGGVEIAKLVDPNGAKDGRTQEYWQSKILDVTKSNNSTSGTELQTTKSGDDETLNGVAFTKVRYYGGKWQVYTTEWIDVDRTQTTVTYTGDNNTGTQTYTGDKNQLVAYYMEVVDIKNDNGSNNLHVNAADWGTKGDATGSWGYTPESDRCSVSIQLVYEDGSLNPVDTTAANLKSKTIVYGYWSDGRGLGTMIFSGQKNYQIYKVTAETGDMTSTTGSGNTITVTSFTWEGNEETVWQGDPTASVSIGNPSRSPSYEEPYDNLAWNTSKYNKNNAILIRVYVKSVARADALNVNYYIEGSTTSFYDYSINVQENTVFNEGFARTDAGILINNTVEDYEGTTRTVQWDLKEMPQVSAQYRYSHYEFVRAERSTDGKTVNLYYTFDSTKTFVVDFGLPMVIKPTDMSENLATATIHGVEINQNTTYAKITTDEKFNVTYTLKQTIDGEDNFGLKYSGSITTATGEQTGNVEYSIKVIPASNVYYEDSFAQFHNGVGNDEMATWTVAGTDASSSPYQALEVLGETANHNVYGYDPAYANSTTFSMGSAHKVTVDASVTTNPTATFTFKGTGFDVISLTDNTSGAIAVDVYRGTKADDNAYEKGYVVNNYYGYQYNKETKTWEVNKENGANALYQIPVIKCSGLTYGEYTVVITPAYDKLFDKTDDNAYSFWLDAIRVYDPMGENAAYADDGEGWPQYIKLRTELKKNTSDEKTTLFIDGADQAKVADYANYGPNNEVYLAQGQAISFKLSGSLENIATVQIGAKSPDGTEAKAKISVNSKEISSATEMYYDITDAAKAGAVVTIANDGADGTILSLTNLKITFKAKNMSVSLAVLSAKDTNTAVAAVRALFTAPVEPEPAVFEPERFEASWNRSSVRAGEKATLTVKTSEDVAAITVDGVTIDTYRTRTQRTGWGWNAKKVTYREFTYTITASETADHAVTAVNAEGTASEAIHAVLTVRAAAQRPGAGGWLNKLFSSWF